MCVAIHLYISGYYTVYVYLGFTLHYFFFCLQSTKGNAKATQIGCSHRSNYIYIRRFCLTSLLLIPPLRRALSSLTLKGGALKDGVGVHSPLLIKAQYPFSLGVGSALAELERVRNFHRSTVFILKKNRQSFITLVVSFLFHQYVNMLFCFYIKKKPISTRHNKNHKNIIT